MKTALRRLLAAAHAFAFSACMVVGGDALVTPGGAEDFPNTVTELGKIAVGDISSSGDWQQVQEIELPEMPTLQGLDSLNVTPPLSRRGLGKTSADGAGGYQYDSLQVDFNRVIDFLFNGVVYVYMFHDTPEFQRRDTVICRYLRPVSSLGDISGKLDSIRSHPHLFLRPQVGRGVIRPRDLPEWQTYRLVNLDDSGAMDFAEYTTHTINPDNSTLRKRVRIYGPDSAYASADAVPEEYEILRRGPAGDTLEWTLVRDADWDRKLWAAGGSGVVDFFLRVRNPAAQPDLSRMHVFMRASLRHSAALGDSLKQLNYQEQRWLRNGRNVTFLFTGAGANGLLAPNDTARMTVDTMFALHDSTIKYTAVYNLLLGSSPDAMQEHKLTGFGITKFSRMGDVFHTVSVFKPSVPVPMGQAGFEGLMSFTAAYRNGDTVQTQGTIGRDSLTLTLRQIKAGVESSYNVILDAAGKLLQATPIAPDATFTPPARRGAGKRSSLP